MKLFLGLLTHNLLCIIIIGIVSGVLIAAIPAGLFKPSKHSSYNDFKFEQGGKFYERHFKISLWKDKVPQFSKIAHRGFSKESIVSLDKEYLMRFYLETIRAEFCHRVLILCAPVFYHLNSSDAWGIAFTILFAAGNVPFIMIQRYNRPRIKKIMDLKLHKNKIVN